MKRAALILAALAAILTAAAAPVRTATENFVTNRIAAAVAAIPSPDFTTNNAALVETIQETAPAPGNYSVVSNRAMNANGNFLAVDGPFFWEAEKAISLKNGFLTLDNTGTGGTTLTMTYGMVSFGYPDSATWRDIIDAANAHAAGDYTTPEDVTAAATAATNYTDWAIQNIDPPIPVFDVYAEDVTNVADFVTSAAISTNNAAFVEAVLAAPIAGASAGDLSEIGEYGSYGTVGAAILALIAGLAALKRRIGTAETAISGLSPKYPMVPVTPSGGTLTVSPYSIATYTAGDSAAAFTVAVGTGTAGVARDCELVIDYTATGAVAPTVTWPSNFHPRTDAETDFACEAGKRNVYFISEFAPGEFAVGGWQETAGGNA